MKRLTLVVAVAATLVAAPAFAVSTSSALLGPIKVNLYDLNPSDGIAPSITFPQGNDYASYASVYASQFNPDEYQYQGNQSSITWTPVSAAANTSLASAQASLTDTVAPPSANGATLAASGTAINPVSNDPNGYSRYDAFALSPYYSDSSAFTLSAYTLVTFTAASSISGSLIAPVTVKDSASASTSLYISGPAASGGIGSQYASDVLNNSVLGNNGPQSFSQSRTLGVSFLNMTNSGMIGTLNVGSNVDGVAYAVPVPEPENYALFLAGLGIMGAIARRRSQANAA